MSSLASSLAFNSCLPIASIGHFFPRHDLICMIPVTSGPVSDDQHAFAVINDTCAIVRQTFRQL
jgi:hypothetical protein